MVRWAVCIGVVAYAVFSIAFGRNLVADGSWAFLQGLQAEGIWLVDGYRIGVGTLGQIPFATAAAAGIDDLNLLRLVHGVGYILIPALVWFLALVLSRRSRLFEILLLGYCSTVLTSGFVAVSDANSVFAYTALYFAVTVRFFATGERGLPYVGLLASILLIFSHGFTVLLSPFLIVAVVLLRRHTAFGDQQRGVWRISIVALALGVLVGAASIVWPYSPGNVVAAGDISAPLGNPQFLLVAIWLAVLPLALLPRTRWVRLAATAVLSVAVVVLAVDDRLWATTREQHATRTMSALLLLLLLVTGLLMVLSSRRAEVNPSTAFTQPALTVLSAGLFVALLVPSVTAAVSFVNYLEDFKSAVRSRQGVIPYDSFVRIVPEARDFDWPYSYSVLSLVLGAGGDHAMVADPLDSKFVHLVDVQNPPLLPSRFTGQVLGS